jgi:FtsP/CotA-like multicopper oxidase with cupredoxin domain
MCLAIAFALLFLLLLSYTTWAYAQTAPSRSGPPQTPLPLLPEATSPVTLRAITDATTGRGVLALPGGRVPPVLHVRPGSVLQICFENAMSRHSTEICIDGPCTNMSNLHFHGLHVSPNSPQDDVISMMTMPGQSLQYRVEIPADQPPGLYWYHTHPHGESYQQALDGMSGALIVDGIERYAPEVRTMRQQILVLRDEVLTPRDAASIRDRARVEESAAPCSSEPEELKRLFTVNGVLRPSIQIRPGEKQFWRIVNASPDLYADIHVGNRSLKVIALDGMPLSFHNPARRAAFVSHVLVAPGGRVEAVVTGPPRGSLGTLSSRCVSTGPDGDPNPAMVLADLVAGGANAATPRWVYAPGPAVYLPVPSAHLAALERSAPDFTVSFTEDKAGFYINGEKYSPSSKPMVTVPVGAFHHWQVVNRSREVHPFHIHQVHFLVYAAAGAPVQSPEWLDTVNVPPRSTVDLIMDFTDPIIRGMSVFHCHLLQHEDKGMMAKILFTAR